jgi:hypothetical protein
VASLINVFTVRPERRAPPGARRPRLVKPGSAITKNAMLDSRGQRSGDRPAVADGLDAQVSKGGSARRPAGTTASI